MKDINKMVVIGIVALVIGLVAMPALAMSAYRSPAEAAAGLTGRTVQSVAAERAQTGKTYGAIANDAGKLDEFKKEHLEIKRGILDAQVEAGEITREQADAILKAIEENQALCLADGSAQIGRGYGAGSGDNDKSFDNGGESRGFGRGRQGGGYMMGAGRQGQRNRPCFTWGN